MDVCDETEEKNSGNWEDWNHLVWWSRRLDRDGLDMLNVKLIDTDWVKCCMTLETEGIKTGGGPKKTWWDCIKDDTDSSGLSQKDVQFRIKWRRVKGQLANSGSPGKVTVKMDTVCVCVCVRMCAHQFCLLFVVLLSLWFIITDMMCSKIASAHYC